MSRLTDLISQVKARDAELGKELEREFKALSSRLPFGLNFERHLPESVELPGRPVRRGDKVRILPPRGSTAKGDKRLWRVRRIDRWNGSRVAHIEFVNGGETGKLEVSADDLIVVAEFRDYIYPGLVSTGKVTRGGDKPFQTVINAETSTPSKPSPSPTADASTRSTSTRRTTPERRTGNTTTTTSRVTTSIAIRNG